MHLARLRTELFATSLPYRKTLAFRLPRTASFAALHAHGLHLSARGITSTDEKLQVAFKNNEGTTSFTSAALRVNDRVRLDKTIFGDAFEFLKSTVTTSVPKLTIPSPSMVHYRGGAAAIDPAVYPDVEEFWSDLSAAYAEEIRRLGELGCTYLQLDDTSLAYLNDPAQRQMIAERVTTPSINTYATYVN